VKKGMGTLSHTKKCMGTPFSPHYNLGHVTRRLQYAETIGWDLRVYG